MVGCSSWSLHMIPTLSADPAPKAITLAQSLSLSMPDDLMLFPTCVGSWAPADHVAPSSSDRLYRTWPFFGQTAHRSFVESLAIVTVAAPPLKPAVDAVPGMVANVPTRV